MGSRWNLAVVAVFVTAITVLLLAGINSQPATLPPCESEDSAGPCIWEANERGNQQGWPFVMIDGVPYYRDVEYPEQNRIGSR